MQFGVLILGIVAICVVATQKVPGGVQGVWHIAEAGGRTHFFEWSPSLTDRMTFWSALIGGVFINLVGLVTDQVSVQRYLTATNLKESQRALWFKLCLTLPLVGIFYLTGLVLYAFYQTHPELLATLTTADRVLPHFVSRELASPLPGLLVAGILAATMSTVSAGLNSLTTATVMDFLYARDQNAGHEKQERGRVRTARFCTLGYGILTTLLALLVSRLGTLVEASNKITGFLGGPLLGIFFLGVFSRRANAQGTLVGAIGGFFSVIAAGYFTNLSFMWYAMLGCLATVIIGEVASYFFPLPSQKQQSFSLRTRSAEIV